jgi:aspartyl-tRNA(Asn)/glutamyl-tRNA(Gln) amidotransferase subunit B
MAKEALPLLMRRGGGAAAALAEASGCGEAASQISDEAAVEELVRGVLNDSAQQVVEYRAGKDKLKGFFLGAVMKRSGGRANPKLADAVLMRLLGSADVHTEDVSSSI